MSIYGSCVIYAIGLYHVMNYPTNILYYLKLWLVLYKHLVLFSGQGTQHYNKIIVGFQINPGSFVNP